MTFDELIDKLNSLYLFINSIIKNNFDKNINKELSNYLNNLHRVLCFVNINYDILYKYYNNKNINIYPFDIFCNNIMNYIYFIEGEYNTYILNKIDLTEINSHNISTINTSYIIKLLSEVNISLKALTDKIITSFNVLKKSQIIIKHL